MRILALLILLCHAVAAPASQPAPTPRAEERILSFDSDLRVNRDGSLDVVEVIRVNVTGAQIRHGIFRLFPLLREDGNAVTTVGFEPVEVTRNGRPERWRVERTAEGATLWIGDPGALLERGEQSYRIRYRTTGEIARRADFDELSWDTGYGWPFTIDRATVRVRLPRAVPFIDSQYLTGPRDGAVLRAALIADRPGDIRVGATQPLRPGEGLSVTVTWRKGVVRTR